MAMNWDRSVGDHGEMVVGAQIRENYHGSDVSCTAVVTVFRVARVFGAAGYCDVLDLLPAVKASAGAWTAQAVARVGTARAVRALEVTSQMAMCGAKVQPGVT
jgi:hypothetical protein